MVLPLLELLKYVRGAVELEDGRKLGRGPGEREKRGELLRGP